MSPGSRRGLATALRGLAALGALVALGAGAAPAERPPPACRAEPSLHPERAFVGQEVVYRLRILRRREVGELRWETGLAFPGFRAEELPGRTGDEIAVAGTPYRVYWERRALFPVRAGRLAIPPARLLCETAAGEVGAPVPGASVAVREPPDEGRPEGWSGLVGEVALSRSVTPRSLALGGSVRVAVTLRGAANVWVVPSPLEGAFPEAVAEVFPRPHELARDAGERLSFRRYWRYDVVPRRSGALEIPPLRVPYFAPEEERYAAATAPAARVEVRPRDEGDGSSEAAPPAPGAPPAEEEGAVPLAPLLGLLAAALLALLGAGAARRRRHERGPRRALAEADAAARGGDVEGERAGLARALRLALEPRVPGARTRAAEELAGALAERSEEDPARRAAEILLELDRARFAGAEEAPAAGRARGAVAALLRARRGRGAAARAGSERARSPDRKSFFS